MVRRHRPAGDVRLLHRRRDLRRADRAPVPLRTRDWFWYAPGAGFVIGAIVWLGLWVVFSLVVSGRLLDSGIARDALEGALWPGGAAGAVAGVVFWLIAPPDRRATSSTPKTAR